MSQFAKINNFGKGIFTISAYETAWVASIPSPADPKVPAFPQCIEWLRNNQLADGSWGSDYPDNVYNKVISTICVVVCLKTWNFEQDQDRIKTGTEAFNRLIVRLENLKTGKTLGFEFILPVLMQRAQGLGVDMNKAITEKYLKIREVGLQRYAKVKSQYNPEGLSKSAWLSLIEGMEPIFKKTELRGLVDSNGIIGHSYSATAFAIITDPTLDKCLTGLKMVVDNNNGAIAAYYPLDIFSLSWSLTFLWMSGCDISGDEFKQVVDTLESYWTQSDGHLGGTMTLEPDADDTSNALFTLNCAGRFIDPGYQHLLEYFRTDHFVTYCYEETPVLTTNLHCLMALKRYKEVEEIKVIIEKTLTWIRTQIKLNDNYLFGDTWHYSPFYYMSRTVLALQSIDDNLCKVIVQKMLDLQNEDGGWGMTDRSTHEETAYAVLAINYWVRSGNKDNFQKSLESIERGKTFLKTTVEETVPLFWITKSMYCLKDLFEVIKYSAINCKLID